MNSIALFAGFFLAVFAAVVAAGYAFLSRRETAAGAPARQGGLLYDPIASSTEVTPETILAEIGYHIGPQGDASRLRENLAAAGYRSPAALAIFNGARIALGSFLGVVMGLIAFVNRDDLFAAIIALCAGAGIGFLMPERYIEWRIAARRNRVRQAVPPALDLMVMSVEAGQSINQAILDTSNELKEAYPDLAAEFAQVNLELRAGKSRADALFRLGERNREPELKKLVSLLIDADRFGSSLGPAMRTHARYLRTRMRQQAQETARKIAVKLIFPVFLLIFPAVLLVTLGPAVIRVFEGFRNLAGQ